MPMVPPASPIMAAVFRLTFMKKRFFLEIWASLSWYWALAASMVPITELVSPPSVMQKTTSPFLTPWSSN